jgi:isopentenyl phosphate kinase
MLLFLKLGGSLITDKSTPETPRIDIIHRVAAEIASGLQARPDVKLLIGHGSGSFGHAAARKHGTRQGVVTLNEWRGFAEVAHVAELLNRMVMDELIEAGIPAIRFSPSASAMCNHGRLQRMAVDTIREALENGLVPVVHGDVAFDEQQGGTILSTEDVFNFIARDLKPPRVLIAGQSPGVLDAHGKVLESLIAQEFAALGSAVRESAYVDVTGGMRSKVESMLALCEALEDLTVHIFSGAKPGTVYTALASDSPPFGTILRAK